VSRTRTLLARVLALVRKAERAPDQAAGTVAADQEGGMQGALTAGLGGRDPTATASPVSWWPVYSHPKRQLISGVEFTWSTDPLDIHLVSAVQRLGHLVGHGVLDRELLGRGWHGQPLQLVPARLVK